MNHFSSPTENLAEFDKLLLEGKTTWWQMELPSGKVIFGDTKAKLLGRESKDFKVYQDFTALLHPDDYEATMTAMRDHLAGKDPYYHCTYRIQTHGGGTLW